MQQYLGVMPVHRKAQPEFLQRVAAFTVIMRDSERKEDTWADAADISPPGGIMDGGRGARRVLIVCPKASKRALRESVWNRPLVNTPKVATKPKEGSIRKR